MYKICITEDSAQRQRELEKAFLAALHNHRYEDISISELCTHMAISRKSFYRYFSGKDGALAALMDHTLMDFISSFNSYSSTLPSPEDVLELYFQFWKEQKPFLDALERSGLSGILYQRALNIAAQDTSLFSHILPDENRFLQEQRIQFLVCGMMTMAISWHHLGYQQTIGQMVQAAKRLLTQPLFSK